jgi:hypothetical protein
MTGASGSKALKYISIAQKLVPSGTRKTHVALGLDWLHAKKGLAVGFITAAALVGEMMEPCDEQPLLRFRERSPTSMKWAPMLQPS